METDLSSLSATEVVPTEDFVTALLEVLVDPVLPLKSSGKDAPSIEQQQSVAKQMHAVVVLYNYFQRKRHPEQEFLGFESFCKLAVNLRPSMSTHMKFMHQSDNMVSDDLENQLSLTETAIMDACKLCLALDVSKDVPSTEEWPISKVAVLLIDSGKKNCALVFSSVTHGVWSVLEKGLDICDISSGSTVVGNKRKRSNKKDLGEEQGGNEAGYQQLAFSAVKEATGLNQTDLMVLESHVVYSLSKEKTAAHFYIVKCMSSIKEHLQVPIKDAIESLQGPLVKKISGSWTVTPVVEFFHVLPYAGIVSKWFCRIFNKEASGASTGSPKQKVNNGCDMVGPTCSISTPHNVEIDGISADFTQKEDQIKNARMAGKVYQHHKKRTSSTERDVAPGTFSVKAETVDFEVTKCKAEKVDTVNKSCITVSLNQDKITIGDRALVPFQMDMKSLEKLQSVLSAKEKEISLTALRVLFRKRERLSHQLRNLGDEIAMCDKNIQTILDGGEDHLALKIDTLLDFCNDVCIGGNTQAQDSTCQTLEDSVLAQQVKGKRLSEATFAFRTPCQELDDICNDNKWTLPTYRVSPLDGGYLANATLKGMDFEWSCDGDMRSSACEARDSAATQMIAKLRRACQTK